MCAKNGFLNLIVHQACFRLLSGADDLITYRFNTGVARHLFCRHCGVESFYVPRSDPDKIDVNVRCLDDVDAEAIVKRPFDGQNWESAAAARQPGDGGAPQTPATPPAG